MARTSPRELRRNLRSSVVRPTGPAPYSAEDTRRRAVVAGSIGNFVEWYDFALYGAFATIIASTFVPGDDPQGGLIVTFGIFAVAFLARPAGALVFGHYGDRVGRRRALAVGILLMAAVTAGIGILPGYAAIGWSATVLLAALRALQGVAIGGEYGGSAAFVVEYAPDGQRGWYGGWQWATVGLGLAAGIGAAALVGAALPASALRDWGWRLPFLAALPLGLIGLYIRTRLEETPAFRALRDGGEVSQAPLVETGRSAGREVGIGFGVVAAVVVTFNLFYVFLPSHLAATGRVRLPVALGSAMVGLVLGSISAPWFGAWSDRRGRKPILMGGILALLVAILPASSLIHSGEQLRMLVGYSLVGVPLGALVLSAFLAELFPTRIRYSGLSLTYGLASAVFGGTAPLAAAFLTRRSGDLTLSMWYATALMAVALFCVSQAPETADRPLDAVA